MATTYLWGIEAQSKACVLSSNQHFWKSATQRELKRISATPHFVWAVGCDQQIYLYVHPTDVPIILQECTYENQVWNPINGFTAPKWKKISYPWSNASGKKSLPRENFKLPSENWAWDEDWYFENCLGAYEGWLYAVSFPLGRNSGFHPEKKTNSLVRRRKWLRHRRYQSMGHWAKIPGIFEDPLKEPFIDIAVGGEDMKYQVEGFLAVWAVSSHGKVYMRQNVQRDCPEGETWLWVETEPNVEFIQLSVGPTGIVWGVLCNKFAAVRNGISRNKVSGESWVYIKAPSKSQLLHVSVGKKVVWAVTEDGKVWFRKGIKGCDGSSDSLDVMGVGWIEMVGNMTTVSVGQDDQVWGVGYDDGQLYYRTGITPAEPSGRNWKAIECRQVKSWTAPGASLEDTDSAPEGACSHPQNASRSDDLPQQYSIDDKPLSLHSLTLDLTSDPAPPSQPVPPASGDNAHCLPLSRAEPFTTEDYLLSLQSANSLPHSKAGDQLGSSNHSSPAAAGRKEEDLHQELPGAAQDAGQPPAGSQQAPPTPLSRQSSSSLSSASDTICDFVQDYQVFDSLSPAEEVAPPPPPEASGPAPAPPAAATASRTGQGTLAEVTTGGAVRLPRDNDVGRDEEAEIMGWTCISAGGCLVDSQTFSNWFSGPSISTLNSPGPLSPEYTNPYMFTIWRKEILQRLQTRQKREVENFEYFGEQALEGEEVTEMKRSEVECWADFQQTPKWSEFTIKLNMANRQFSRESSSSFSICKLSSDRHKLLEVSLVDMTCVLAMSQAAHHQGHPGHHAFAIYTAERTCTRTPLKVRVKDGQELDQWVATLSSACCQLRGLRQAPPDRCLWATTTRHDVFAHQPQADFDVAHCNEMFWRQIGGHLEVVETCPAGIVWGLAFGNYSNHPWAYTGGYGGGPFQSITDHRAHKVHQQSCTKQITIYENQRWKPVLGFTSPMYTDRPQWSDAAGNPCRSTQEFSLPSTECRWVDEWAVDYSQSDKKGGGWQYALNFTSSYHKDKKSFDYVRRRKWTRKCRLMTTGPWVEVHGLPMLDLSLQVDPDLADRPPDRPVALWAISSNGQAFIRHRVTKNNPQGEKWIHVMSDQKFQSISVGGSHRVWAIGKDGIAFFRNGVSPSNPQGNDWFAIDPPPGMALKQVSAGLTAVWAVDNNKGLWFRENITVTYPEGTEWVLVCDNVRKVCVGPQNQVWIIADRVGKSNGVVCRRLGISQENLKGTEWENGIGGGWKHVTVRAMK